jgi:hypothetical protein
MKLAILSRILVPLWMVLFCCIMFGLLTANSATAQSNNTRISMPMSDKLNDYAELAIILPSRVNVEADTLKVLNYTEGRTVRASILLNGSMVNIYLLYPCQPPQTLLSPEALKSMMIASNPSLMQANFSDQLIGIGGLPAIFGLTSNQVIAAYQPTNQTAALIIMDQALPMETMEDFLGNMTITPNEGVTPLWSGYCPDTTAAPAEVAPVSAETTATANETAVANPAPSTPAAATPTVAEIVKGKTMSRNEKMAADRAAALAKLDAERQKMKGY